MAVNYLPNVAPPNNNTQQVRRRVNDLVSTVNDGIGSIASGNGDIGTLNSNLQSFESSLSYLNAGITGSVVLAKLTTGGTNGSLTFNKGIITAVVHPT
jgi:hypothetical protein